MSQDQYTAYRTIARLGALLLVLLGSLVLLGWLWHVGFLTTVLPGRITMKPKSLREFNYPNGPVWASRAVRASLQ
jgi:hypothetical protein